MTKHDWEEHKKRYLEEYPELTLAAYAALFGLNPSTTRRAMRGIKSAAKGNVVQQPKSQPKSDHSNGNDHLPSDRPAEEPCASPITKKPSKTIKSGRYKRKALRDGGGHTQKNDHLLTATPLVGNTENDHIEHLTDFGNKMAQYIESLTAQNHTGGYVSLINLDDDIQKAALELARDNRELALAYGRYLQLYRCKENAVKEVEAAYASGEVWFYPGTETPMPLTMAVMQTEMAPAQRLAELERYIGTRKTSQWNQRRAEFEREREATAEAILAKRSENGWSALETAQALELKGLKLPRSLELEVAREVSFIEPITDADGGISDAELEEMSRAYMAEQKEIMEVWLPNRRAEVAAAVAAAVAAEAARQNSELLDEDDFNPLSDELSDTGWDEDGKTLTEVAEEWA
ncbi:hypothetical protein [Aeromonas veronii]|uniref:hypothetical protein n=1 Tax=Aeromonas veronii TaxID=654 RepID=UPI002B46FB00|nr:hypothetical protein [Aeromonas veronii]